MSALDDLPPQPKVRRKVAFCPCTGQCHLRFDTEWQWYEPQDIIKGIGIAKKRGYPDGFFAPYKLCATCRYSRCKNVFD